MKKTIRIAILANELFEWGSGKHYFKTILHNYTWKKNNTLYEFHPSYIKDKDILDGKLQVSNYDLLLVPGGGVGE